MANTVTDMAMDIKTINSIFLFTQQKYRIKEILIWEDFFYAVFFYFQNHFLFFLGSCLYISAKVFFSFII